MQVLEPPTTPLQIPGAVGLEQAARVRAAMATKMKERRIGYLLKVDSVRCCGAEK